MTTTADRLADLIDQAPAWARIGLTISNDRLRTDATHELARFLADGLEIPETVENTSQLDLPL
jgi:hypothetical protein